MISTGARGHSMGPVFWGNQRMQMYGKLEGFS